MTKTEDQTPKIKTRRIFWILFALAIAAFYFFGLTIPLVGPDEPRYSQIAREMFERGDFVTPKLGGFDWFEKPALLYWLQIAAYKIFGVTEFAARFGSALFGLGTILCLWILGKNVSVSGNAEKSHFLFSIFHFPFSNWLALIAASSIGLIAFSRGASFDIILTFPITASLVAFFIFDQSKEKSFSTFHFPLFTFYFFIGVALLAKGLIGIVFPLAIVAFYYLLSWRLPSKTFVFSLFWGTLLSLIVAAAWYVPMYQANGWKFVDEFFIQHHFERFTSDKYQHHQPFYFFFLVLPLMTLPWLPFFLAAIWNFVKIQSSRFRIQDSRLRIQDSRFTIQDSRTTIHDSTKLSTLDSRLSTFAFAWLFVPLVFFSFSGSKLPGYILPALPAAIILTAQFVYSFASKSEKRARALQILAASTFIIAALLLQFVVPKYAYQDSVKGLIEAVNASGYENEKIVNLYTVSHNLEFYAAGRLIREADGKQKLYDNYAVLIGDLRNSESGRILVRVPQKDLANVMSVNDSLRKKILAENDEEAIVLLEVK
jgi:4-amino-4-deoxy-L-arabinose transferase-like glycosyltransferase